MKSAGGLAGTEAGNEAAVLLQVVGDLHGVELDGGIEIAESNDHQEVEDHVQHRLGVNSVQEAIPEGALRRLPAESGDGRGDAWRWTERR